MTGNILLVVFRTFIIALSLYFFFGNAVAFLYGYRNRTFGNTLFNNQLWVVLHLVGGTLALLPGPFQFWPVIRNKLLSFHRFTGEVYLFDVLLIGISTGP